MIFNHYLTESTTPIQVLYKNTFQDQREPTLSCKLSYKNTSNKDPISGKYCRDLYSLTVNKGGRFLAVVTKDANTQTKPQS